MIERDLRIRIAADARRVALEALAEDGTEDSTTRACISGTLLATGALELRSGGIMAGQAYADAVAEACTVQSITWYHGVGASLPPGTTLGLLQDELTPILRAERPLLNLLQRAIGIATHTRTFVDAVAGTGARILHTRKTAPGLRLLDVSAVLAGGGALHRLELGTTVMVKDNHWRALERGGRTLADALSDARGRGIGECMVEVETPEQVTEAVEAGATRILIDNQTPKVVRQWGERARGLRPGIAIEATGGITLANVRRYAEAGADFISVGALTHSVRAADVSLEVGKEG